MRRDELDVVRIPLGTADLMLAADLAVAAGAGVLERNARAAVIGNLDLAATAEFKRNAVLPIDAALHRRVIETSTDARASVSLHGVRLAERLFGNAQAMNTLLLGLAWQRGLIPVGEAAILRSIELNGAAVKTNLRAFLWGRILAEKPELIGQILTNTIATPPDTLQAVIATRMAALTAYQSRRYAARYRKLVDRVIARETAVFGKPGRLSRAAAEGLHRVMAYKDEYEVARLHAAATYGEQPGIPPVATVDQPVRSGDGSSRQGRNPRLVRTAAVPCPAPWQISARDGAGPVRAPVRAGVGTRVDRRNTRLI